MDGKIDWPCDVYPPGPGFHSPADSHVSQRPVQNRYVLGFNFTGCYTFVLTPTRGKPKTLNPPPPSIISKFLENNGELIYTSQRDLYKIDMV